MSRLATLDQDLEENLQGMRKAKILCLNSYIKVLKSLIVYLVKRLEDVER